MKTRSTVVTANPVLEEDLEEGQEFKAILQDQPGLPEIL